MTDAHLPLPSASPRPAKTAPPDWEQRQRALDPERSFLVQAPAGSGKTYLLTQRFLRLLALANKPEEIVAITFTHAAAAEMRNRILEALEQADGADTLDEDPASLESLARMAMEHSRLLGWEILDQPSQLRVMTIDSFCRSIALQSPLSWGLLSGLGGTLDTVENAGELYAKAARRTLESLEMEDSETRRAVEAILLWRDNNWQDVETMIAGMLRVRNRWYQEFVFAREKDWEALRRRLEAPFVRSANAQLKRLCALLDGLPECREFALALARSACEIPGRSSPKALAERAEFPETWEDHNPATARLFLDDALSAYRELANFLMTKDGLWRKKGGLNAINGFPPTPEGRAAKERFEEFVLALGEQEGLQDALAAFQKPMPVGYTEEEWQLTQHCFTLLRDAAGQLQVVFAETGSVDFTEIAQIALRILTPEDGLASEVAIRMADGIHHLLVDEFQDTSRNQHQLLAYLIGAWPDRDGRSCFCVGDPMQSIYGFREAEVELFERLKTRGFEIGFALDAQPYRLDFVSLRANFRTVPTLVNDLNDRFERIFAIDDGSGVSFSSAVATRESASQAATQLHLAFAYQGNPEDRPFGEFSPEPMRAKQMQELVALIEDRLTAAGPMRAESAGGAANEKYRIAVLARTRSSLVRVAQALDDAGIGYRAIDLVQLRERAEVLDVLALARALMNPVDRTAWLAVLRAPWCGLTLEDLHRLTSADDAMVLHTPVPELLATRLPQLFRDGLLSAAAFHAANRVGRVLREAAERRAGGSAIAHQTFGTWLESVWKALGGAATVNPSQLENLRLLWSSLDELPEGEVDLLGAGLHAALENLFALPDPGASSSFGVQLMTIHKSKGLEFEVVIVPDLEAAARNSTPEMISWLERGLPGEDAPQDESQLSGGQLTEFLIAPIQARGTDRGTAKEWVDGVKRARETQELRRVLYVAATRARQELHLFARPRFAIRQRETGPILNTEAGLLKTAWPAFGEQVEAEFRAWCAAIQDPERPDATEGVVSLAASGGNLLQMPGPGDAFSLPKTAMLRRLPPGYEPPAWNRHASLHAARDSSADLPGDESRQLLYRRTAGGMESRLLGTAIHALLEHLTALRMTLTPTGAAAKLPEALPALVAEIRSHGLRRTAAERLAAEALHVAREASLNATGAWILSPHTHAETESRWTGLIETGPIESDSIESHLIGPQNEQSSPSRRRQRWNVRPDRVFYAPMPSFLQDFPDTAPGTPEPQWWIIDYKSSQGSPSILTDPREQREFLKAHRNQYAAQLDAYAQVLRQLRLVAGDLQPRIRIGIFYPRLRLLDHWT